MVTLRQLRDSFHSIIVYMRVKAAFQPDWLDDQTLYGKLMGEK